MTYEVQQTRWDRIIRRVSGSVGPGSRVSETLSELFPVLDVERVPGELLILGGTRLCWQSTERPAVAGQRSASQLINPADSGTLVTVSALNIRVATAANVQIEITDTLLTVDLVAGLFRDGRLGTARETTAKVASIDNIGTGGGPRYVLQAGVLFPLEDENSIAVLGPGQALQVGSVTNNTLMTVNYSWRERPAEPSELQF